MKSLNSIKTTMLFLLMVVSATLFAKNNSVLYNDNTTDKSNVILYEDFENGAIPNGWITIDADGDGNNWGSDSIYYSWALGHNGTHCTFSASYIGYYGALTPDNYLITHILEGAKSVKYWVSVHDPMWPSDHYAIMASTTGTDIEDFEIIFEETMTAKYGGTWYERTINLPEGTKYIAWRHYNCTDVYILRLDDVTVYNVDIVNDLEPVTDFTATRIKYNLGCLNWKYPNGYQANNKEKQLTGYKIYADNELLAEINDVNILQYTDSTYYSKGTLSVEYCITAVYDGTTESEQVCETIQYTTTSIDNSQLEIKLKIYPNPASNYIRVEGLPEGKSTIEFYNIAGSIVLQKQTNETDTEIDISGLNKGIYLVKITNSIGVKTEKIEIK